MAPPESGTRERPRGYEQHLTDSNLPIPDPTRLTTELVDRSISAFREVFEVRLADLDKAILLADQQVKKIPADTALQREQQRAEIDSQMLALREFILSRVEKLQDVNAEKFESINSRFLERDIRIDRAAQEARMSLDSAMAAAKEAVAEQNKANVQAIAKAEVATQKQIDALVQLMTTSNKSLEDKIADVKTRLDRGEGRSTGSAEARTEKRLDVGALIQAIALIATIAGLIIVAFRKGG
jgi:hypothetical protein